MTELPDIYAGDKITYNISFVDSSDVAIDITGSTVYFTLKAEDSPTADEVVAKEITSHDDATNGLSSVTLTNSDTQSFSNTTYYFELLLALTAGEPVTVLKGLVRCHNKLKGDFIV